MMRLFILFILIGFAFSCQHSENGSGELAVKEATYTEADARKFFEDSIAGPDYTNFDLEKFPRFLKRYYPELKTATRNALIYALEEQFIDTSRIDTSKQWFRVIVDPCFGMPYSMIVEKRAEKNSLVVKLTNGSGCQYPGVLASTTKFMFVGELYDTIATKLESLNFWTLGEDTTCHGGLDGANWLIEAMDKGKYNVVSRWLPQHCGDSTTRNLAGIVRHLANVGRLDAILSAIGAPKSRL